MSNTYEKNLLLQGKTLASLLADKKKISTFSDVEFSVFSQWGEDGIIEWLVSKIKGIPKTFIEFGVENYEEANTRFLLLNRNWRGLVFDSSQENITHIQSSEICWRYDLTARLAFIDKDNINTLIEKEGFTGDIGLLSIDIDGNDYWVWEAIHCVKPAIVICEFNANFGDMNSLVIPYAPLFSRFEGHYSGLYFGASIAAFVHLGKVKGYTFIGTPSTGINAFFVRDDLLHLLDSAPYDVSPLPTTCSDVRNSDGILTFERGSQKIAKLLDLPVMNLHTRAVKALGEFWPLFSPRWAEILRINSEEILASKMHNKG